MQRSDPVIIWFRDDLRLSDHPALHAAVKTQAPVICLYVLDEASSARQLGGAARWWLAQSLRVLQTRLQAIDGTLVLRRGSTIKIILELARQTQARAVFWNDIAQAPHEAVAARVAAALKEIGVSSQSFPGDLLAHPSAIRTKDGRGLRVFTAFWRRLLALGDPPAPLPAPRSLKALVAINSETVEGLDLEPTRPDFKHALVDCAKPGTRGKHRRRLDSSHFSKTVRVFMQAIGIGLIATAHLSYRRTFALERSAHVKFGTRSVLAPLKRPDYHDTWKSSLASSAGASSVAICCSICPTSRLKT